MVDEEGKGGVEGERGREKWSRVCRSGRQKGEGVEWEGRVEEWLSAFINTELETEFESHIPLEGLFCVK